MQNQIKKYQFTESTLDGFRAILSNKEFRKKLEAKELLTDYDVVFLTMDYMAKTGVSVEMNKAEFDSFMKLTHELEDAYNGKIYTTQLSGMEDFARLTHVQSLLLKNLKKREELIRNIEPKKRKDKKLCERLVKEYENLWAILASRVVKNYSDFASTRDGFVRVSLTDEEYINSQKDVMAGGVNLTKAMAKLYRNKVGKDYVISNLPTREVDFKRELPKIIKDNKSAFVPIIDDIYDDMRKDITSGRTYEYLPAHPQGPVYNSSKSNKILTKVAALVVSGAVAFTAAGGALSQIINRKDDTPSVSIPDEPDNQTPPVVVPPTTEDKWGDKVIVTDDPEVVAPNAPEENEKEPELVSPIPDDNDPENDTIVPDLQPGDNTNVFEPVQPETPETPENPENPETPEESETPEEPETPEVIEPDPGYDKPNDPVPGENNSNNEKQETEGSVEDREDNFWTMG